MASPPPDPFRTLGLTPGASDEEIRRAYRRLAQLHHPDHNDGSRESALRFAEVQEAYAHVMLMRKQADVAAGGSARRAPATGSASTSGTASRGDPTSPPGPRPGPAADPALEARLAAMERELQAARARREQAARAAAQEAARAVADGTARQRTRAGATRREGGHPASDEELGYYSTDDSFSKIFDDFADQVAARLAETRPPHRNDPPRTASPGRGGPRSVADWIDEIGSRLTGEPPRRKRD
jgi:hypothetical protein